MSHVAAHVRGSSRGVLKWISDKGIRTSALYAEPDRQTRSSFFNGTEQRIEELIRTASTASSARSAETQRWGISALTTSSRKHVAACTEGRVPGFDHQPWLQCPPYAFRRPHVSTIHCGSVRRQQLGNDRM